MSAGITTATLSLTADKLYGYTAYSGAGCTSGKEFDTEYFSANDYDVGNLGETAYGNCIVGYSAGSRKCAVAFTTGDRSGGYTLKHVAAEFIAKLETSGTLGDIIVAVHAADTANSANPGEYGKGYAERQRPGLGGLVHLCLLRLRLRAVGKHDLLRSHVHGRHRRHQRLPSEDHGVGSGGDASVGQRLDDSRLEQNQDRQRRLDGI